MDELYEQMQLEILPVDNAPIAEAQPHEQAQPEATPSANGPAIYEDFGCCSRFHQCSDAGACLIPERTYSQNCIYRKSLEAGKVFYGKNAGRYRPEVYQDFVEKYRSLSDAEANTLHSVLHYTFAAKPASMSFMAVILPEFSDLENLGFFRLTMHSKRLMKKCSLNAMVEACGERIIDANQWAKSNCTENAWADRKKTQKDFKSGIKISKDELENWITLFHPEISKKLPASKSKRNASLLVAACSEYIQEANQWAMDKCSSETEWARRKNTSVDVGPDIKIFKDELEHWILQFAPDIFSELSKGITFIEFDPDNRLELSEFFFDHIYQKQDIPILATCENDPRFLSSEKRKRK